MRVALPGGAGPPTPTSGGSGTTPAASSPASLRVGGQQQSTLIGDIIYIHVLFFLVEHGNNEYDKFIMVIDRQ